MSLIKILKSRNYRVIDVREPLELEMDGSVEGAENIPLGEVESRKDEILSKDNETNTIIICKSGGRSTKALEYLQSQGLKNGYNGGSFASFRETLENL